MTKVSDIQKTAKINISHVHIKIFVTMSADQKGRQETYMWKYDKLVMYVQYNVCWNVQ